MIRKGDKSWIKNNNQMQEHINKHNNEGALDDLTKDRIKELGLN